MAERVGSLIVNLALESGAFSSGLNQAQKDLKAATKRMEAAGQSMAEFGQKMTLGITAPLAAFGGLSVKAASDAAELQSAFNQTFGAMQGAMNDWAKTTGDALGRSTQEMQKAANTFGLFFNQAAPTKAAAADLSKTFAVLAQDLSSFYNVDPGTAMDKLRSGLSGETEPLRDFGVFMNEAAVKAKALEMGLAGANGELSEQAKIMARAQIILESTKNAQGDVERTSDGMANRFRATRAAVEEMQVSVGEKLQPVMLALLGVADKVLTAFNSLSPGMQTAVVVFAGIAAAAGPVAMALGGIMQMVAPFSAALSLIAGQGGLLLAAQAGFAGLMTVLAPLAVPIAAIAAAGALIYANWEKIAPVLEQIGSAMAAAFSPAIQAIIDAVKEAFAEFMGSDALADIQAFIGVLGDVAVVILKAFGGAMPGIIGALGDILLAVVKVIIQGVKLVVAVLSGDWSGAWEAAKGLVMAAVQGIGGAIANLASAGVGFIKGLVQGIKDWMGDKLNAIWDWAAKKIDWVKDKFFGLYDAVVGHSYIPDMVDGIADHMGRLDQVMVKPAVKAVDAAKEAFKQLQTDVQGIMGNLFPDAREIADFRKELATLDRGIAAGGAGGYTADQLRAGRQRLIEGAPSNVLASTPLPLADQLARFGTVPLGSTAGIQDALGKLAKAANDNSDKIGVANVRIADSFKEMADKTLSAINQVVGAVKGGSFLDILSSVINLGLQLGSIGAFGKNVQTRINTPVPGYASGTSYAPGGLAMVGERGPELVNLPRGSQVIPNHALRGGSTQVEVIPSPYFDVRVQQNIGMAAPGIAQAGARAGEQRIFARQRRKVA